MLDFFFQTVFEHVTGILVVKHVLQEMLINVLVHLSCIYKKLLGDLQSLPLVNLGGAK